MRNRYFNKSYKWQEDSTLYSLPLLEGKVSYGVRLVVYESKLQTHMKWSYVVEPQAIWFQFELKIGRSYKAAFLASLIKVIAIW